MPFICEELWHTIHPGHVPQKSIALSSYPKDTYKTAETDLEELGVSWQLMQNLIGDIRAQRKERKVPERESTPVQVAFIPFGDWVHFFRRNLDIIAPLARVSRFDFVEPDVLTDRPGVRISRLWSLDVNYEQEIDIPAERERLTKEIAKLEKNIASAERQLGNDAFLAKAPPAIVEGLKKQEAENRLLLEKAKAALATLPPE
jgi:valyl-tRNA synthetase